MFHTKVCVIKVFAAINAKYCEASGTIYIKQWKPTRRAPQIRNSGLSSKIDMTIDDGNKQLVK
jgi:hypothetical protein